MTTQTIDETTEALDETMEPADDTTEATCETDADSCTDFAEPVDESGEDPENSSTDKLTEEDEEHPAFPEPAQATLFGDTMLDRMIVRQERVVTALNEVVGKKKKALTTAEENLEEARLDAAAGQDVLGHLRKQRDLEISSDADAARAAEDAFTPGPEHCWMDGCRACDEDENETPICLLPETPITITQRTICPYPDKRQRATCCDCGQPLVDGYWEPIDVDGERKAICNHCVNVGAKANGDELVPEQSPICGADSCAACEQTTCEPDPEHIDEPWDYERESAVAQGDAA